MKQKVFNMKFYFSIFTGDVAVLSSHTAKHPPASCIMQVKILHWNSWQNKQNTTAAYLETWMD